MSSKHVTVNFSNSGKDIITVTYTNHWGAKVEFALESDKELEADDFKLHKTYKFGMTKDQLKLYHTHTLDDGRTEIDVNKPFTKEHDSFTFVNKGEQIISGRYTDGTGVAVSFVVHPGDEEQIHNLSSVGDITFRRGKDKTALPLSLINDASEVDVNDAFDAKAPSTFTLVNKGSQAILASYTDNKGTPETLIVSPGDHEQVTNVSLGKGITAKRGKDKKAIALSHANNAGEIDVNEPFE
ncbi:hypothetical protein DFH11DRAFT_1629855 [Phellopilus nigrolimitatus]|nr:hypothetical protein DFH11DRAFT_1629855 [Phellopilus nigrolimitatus]